MITDKCTNSNAGKTIVEWTLPLLCLTLWFLSLRLYSNYYLHYVTASEIPWLGRLGYSFLELRDLIDSQEYSFP